MLTGIVVVGLAECLGWFFVFGLGWSLRFLFVGPESPEAADRTRWALVILALAALNSIALLAFLIRRRGWGRILLTGVQIGDLAFASIALVVVEAHWSLFAAAAILMLILLLLYRRSLARLVGGDGLEPTTSSV